MIRLPTLIDAPELFALADRNRSRLREWLPWLDANTRVEHTQQFIQHTLQGHAQGTSFTNLIIHEGQIAGVVGFNTISKTNRQASIGYWIGGEYSGRGILTRAVVELIDAGFAGLNLHRIDIRAAPGNARSCSVPERLGFTHEGTLREVEWLYDHWVDLRVYAVLAHEWPAKRAAYLSKWG